MIRPIQIYTHHIKLMQQSCATLNHILRSVSQEDATTYRDNGAGWTALETLGHIRDFDGFFRERAQMMIKQQHPTLPAYDHDALVIERQYNQQNLQTVLDELNESRTQTIEFFKSLNNTQWQMTGIHPERERFDMIDAVIQIGLHDCDHLEQITRILSEKRTASA